MGKLSSTKLLVFSLSQWRLYIVKYLNYHSTRTLVSVVSQSASSNTDSNEFKSLYLALRCINENVKGCKIYSKLE